MNDPYKVLEISPDATDEEVKKAYKKLAKKYHPDNFVDNPLFELAEEKMKEINDAYNTIMRQRSEQGKRSSGRASFSQIRMLINQGRIGEAETYLRSVPESEHNAEWNFLTGLCYATRGYYYEARKYIENAIYMDPDNNEYRNTLNRMSNISNERKATYSSSETHTGATGCNPCSVCQALLCADCCCECMGGDLIRCC